MLGVAILHVPIPWNKWITLISLYPKDEDDVAGAAGAGRQLSGKSSRVERWRGTERGVGAQVIRILDSNDNIR